MSEKPFRLAVRAVVLGDQRQCLLLRRSVANRSFVGTWEWPGGKVEDGESFDAGVCREVREEAGLEIVLTGVAGAYQIETAELHLVVLCMEAKVASGVLRISEEHDQSAWVPLSELSQWNLTAGFREFALGYAKRVTKGS